MMRASCLGAGLLLLAGLLSPGLAGMDEDLASCTAAKGRDSANACTRVMDQVKLHVRPMAGEFKERSDEGPRGRGRRDNRAGGGRPGGQRPSR